MTADSVAALEALRGLDEGRREIQRLRSLAELELGPAFDIKDFHGVVLGDGAVPLGVLGVLVTDWIKGQQGDQS